MLCMLGDVKEYSPYKKVISITLSLDACVQYKDRKDIYIHSLRNNCSLLLWYVLMSSFDYLTLSFILY